MSRIYVPVANPAKKKRSKKKRAVPAVKRNARTRTRKKEITTMAKHKRAKRKSPRRRNPKKKHHAVAVAATTRRRGKRRAAKKHTHWGAVSSHKRRVNPRRHHVKHRRHARRRKNPEVGTVLKAAAFALGAGAFALVVPDMIAPGSKAAFYGTVGALAVAGMFAAKKHPVAGLAIAGGAVSGALSMQVALHARGLLSHAAPVGGAKPMGAVRMEAVHMSGVRPIAPQGPSIGSMGAVGNSLYRNRMSYMGAGR
jgi:hypothetical protein